MINDIGLNLRLTEKYHRTQYSRAFSIYIAWVYVCIHRGPYTKIYKYKYYYTCVLPRGGTQVILVYASGQCMEQRSCGCSQLWHSVPPGMAVGRCELRLRSTPRYRLVCICFPTPGRGLPYGSGLGLSRCPGECLHSFKQDCKC